MDYTSIDFETANSSTGSACALGVVQFKRGKIVFSKAYLIKPHPEHSKFNWYNTKIHGLTAGDVARAPTFDQVWAEIAPLLQNQIVVCHNATFDMGVLRKMLALYHLEEPICRYVCTVEISQKVWNQLEKHKLNIISEHLGIALNHHEAESDAMAAGLVLKAALDETKSRKVSAMMKKLGLKMKQFVEE